MKIASFLRRGAVTLLAFATIIGYSTIAIGQNATSPTGGDKRILVVMADGTSSVHKISDQRLKIRTTSGESEVPLSKIVYIYQGKARLYSDPGIVSGEVVEGPVQVQTDDGATKPIATDKILFLSVVRGELSGKSIKRLEIIVADGKVTKNVLPPSAASSGHDQPTKPSAPTAAPASALSSVVILDEYWEDRLYTLSNPSYGAVVKKEDQTFHGPPFPVECDVVTHQQYAPDPLMTIFLVFTEAGRDVRMGQSCRSTVAGSGSLVKGIRKRTNEDFGMCLKGIEGSGEVYLFVEAAGPREVYKKPLCTLELHRTVSNVLRLPVRFE